MPPLPSINTLNTVLNPLTPPFFYLIPQYLTPGPLHHILQKLLIQGERLGHYIRGPFPKKSLYLHVIFPNPLLQKTAVCGDTRLQVCGMEGDIDTCKRDGGNAAGKLDGGWEGSGGVMMSRY